MNEIKLAKHDEGEDNFNQLWIAQLMHFYQSLFWLYHEKSSIAMAKPDTHYIEIPAHGNGVDVLRKDDDSIAAFIGGMAALELTLVDDLFKLAGGDGIPRQTDDDGDLLPIDVQHIKAEFQKLLEQHHGN